MLTCYFVAFTQAKINYERQRFGDSDLYKDYDIIDILEII